MGWRFLTPLQGYSWNILQPQLIGLEIEKNVKMNKTTTYVSMRIQYDKTSVRLFQFITQPKNSIKFFTLLGPKIEKHFQQIFDVFNSGELSYIYIYIYIKFSITLSLSLYIYIYICMYVCIKFSLPFSLFLFFLFFSSYNM